MSLGMLVPLFQVIWHHIPEHQYFSCSKNFLLSVVTLNNLLLHIFFFQHVEKFTVLYSLTFASHVCCHVVPDRFIQHNMSGSY
jgi:hypothetical protein